MGTSNKAVARKAASPAARKLDHRGNLMDTPQSSAVDKGVKRDLPLPKHLGIEYSDQMEVQDEKLRGDMVNLFHQDISKVEELRKWSDTNSAMWDEVIPQEYAQDNSKALAAMGDVQHEVGQPIHADQQMLHKVKHTRMVGCGDGGREQTPCKPPLKPP